MRGFQILKYYSKEKVQKEMIKIAKDREVVGTFLDGSFSKRPDVLTYPRDVEERVKQGVVSFHCSVEKWKNPMSLSSEMNQTELDNLRKGWDYILDLDSKLDLEHAKIAVLAVQDFLKDFGIKISLKFSGSRGFHIFISEKAFPKDVIDNKKIAERYPRTPQIITEFIRHKIKDQLLDELIKYEGGMASLFKKVENVSELSPYAFVEFEKEWGNRHLFRMPYSLHTKTWLVSLPLEISEIKKFKPENAKPENINFNTSFLKSKGDATELLLQALDWSAKQKPEEIIKEKRKISIKTPIPEQYFPPCIKSILNGLSDGRKRSIFTLSTFLQRMNWDPKEIEKRIREWNEKNTVSLRDNTIRTQLKWHLRQNREILPANCESELFYRSVGVCKPDNICKGNKITIKNPVNYAFKVLKRKRYIKNK